MPRQKPENKTVSKIYAPQSTRGRGRPKSGREAPIYLQTGFAPHIYEKLQRIAKDKGINESDIIRLVVGNAVSSLSL